MAKRYYVTTPIYYVNAVPHVGHALTTLVCDVTKRWHRMRGEDVFFLTGTDENGLKVMEAAEEAGETPQAFVDRISGTFVEAFKALNIDYDAFFRTTSERHKEAVSEFFNRLKANDFVYLDNYEGWYDVSAETFVKESDLVDGKSPDGNEVRRVKEENWFFRLSAFEDRLLEKIEGDPNFLMPPGRRNEVLSFVKSGLRDICISRSNPGWGIPVPGDDKRVLYVWFDAVINYLSATGWPEDGWENLWPADVHWMAKEIYTRFHATMWPAMLMAVGLPLPKTVIAHGWFTFNEAKMSKSKGNVLSSSELISHFEDAGCTHDLAVDAVRYALAKSLPYDNDTNFTYTEIDRLYNADLANDLGNSLNRALTMAHKFAGGFIPDAPIASTALLWINSSKLNIENAMEEQKVHFIPFYTLSVNANLNAFIEEYRPWDLAKNNDPLLGSVIRTMLYAVRCMEGLIRPVMPASADAIAMQLGLPPLTSWDEIGTEASLPEGTKLEQPVPMFPRLEKKKEVPVPKKEKKVTEKQTLEQPDEIEFADFMKVKLQVGRIIEAEPVEESKKLMKLQVKIGDETRQIIAGIKGTYSAEDLIGRQVVVVANLKPRKMMGLESQGMILAADDTDGSAILLEPEHEAPEGTSVH